MRNPFPGIWRMVIHFPPESLPGLHCHTRRDWLGVRTDCNCPTLEWCLGYTPTTARTR